SKSALVALRGPTTFFGDGNKPRRLEDIGNDGMTTVMLVHANHDFAPIWTKPEDLAYDPTKPFRGLATTWSTGFFRETSTMVITVDRAPRFLRESTAPEILRAMFSIEKAEQPKLSLPWYAVLDRPNYKALMLGGLAISVALIAASFGVIWRLW